MTRRPLPRVLGDGAARLARSREPARTAVDGLVEALRPLVTIVRGLRLLTAAARRKWTETPRDRRGPLLFLVASVILVVALTPYGPHLAGLGLMAAAARRGRDTARPASPEGPDTARGARLAALYEALVPYFALPEDPDPLYRHGGDWHKAFPAYEFDESGRFSHLVVRYPAYFTDGEAAARLRIEYLLTAKAGRGREYHYVWDEEANHLTLTVLPPLPADITAQHFVTAPGETVLGFTDPTRVRRTLPLGRGDARRDVPPVVWRTGARSTEPHLLALGRPGSGTSTLLRSIALQALRDGGDLIVVDGGGTGEYACLRGREGVLAVECGLSGALTVLRWAAQETERRLLSLDRARQEGRRPPEDTGRPLWVLLDRPGTFSHLAAAEGRRDPQSFLQAALRHGRAARVTVVVADQLDCVDTIEDAVWRHTHARVVLGPATADQLAAVLGVPPGTTLVDDVPPGRGYARLGTQAVLRLQVPATPDPYDEATGDAERQAVLALLPPFPETSTGDERRSGEADTEATAALGPASPTFAPLVGESHPPERGEDTRAGGPTAPPAEGGHARPEPEPSGALSKH
ncbi:ABC transporter ATP-binding protein [Streptomyces sp. WMMC905]|uniref:ATP-binding cassette domain-containing protein n=1 Tax=Streptomyces sp. WMMC905 TaxID=3404123 RepID=UPI003B944520